MKSSKTYLLSICFSILLMTNLFGQTGADSVAIREASLNYIEGFYTNNATRVEKAVHPELAKRVITKDEKGNMMLRNMGASELAFNAKKFVRPADPSTTPFKAVVTIFDIAHETATVKVTQNKMTFFDYLHLGKINGEWKIINVLWARTAP
jgi:hypothetical protein